MIVLKRAAIAVSGLIAVAAMVVLITYLPAASASDGWGYPALASVAMAAAWIACFAWATDRRLIAVPGHLLTVFLPWGYLYPLPLAAIILALIAGATFRSSRQPLTQRHLRTARRN